MKNFLTTLILFAVFISANAQNDDYKMVAGIHAGYSLTGALVKNIADVDPSSNIDATAIPAMQLTFDYGLSKLFSIGAAVSYQNVSINVTDYSFIDGEGNSRTETFKTNFNRSQIAIRPLIHYANNDKLDLYSGFRIGILSRGFSDFKGDNVSDIDEEVFDGTSTALSGSRFSFGITAFGLRYYFTDNIGAGLEINWGAPYITNIGVSARF